MAGARSHGYVLATGRHLIFWSTCTLQSRGVRTVGFGGAARAQRITGAWHDHMPALNLDLKPRGRGASVRPAAIRHRDRAGMEEREVPQPEVREEQPPSTALICNRRCRRSWRASSRDRRRSISRETSRGRRVMGAANAAMAMPDWSRPSGCRGPSCAAREGAGGMMISRGSGGCFMAILFRFLSAVAIAIFQVLMGASRRREGYGEIGL